MRTKFDDILVDSLTRLGDAFDLDYLTYATLTGKNERSLVAALAWCIRTHHSAVNMLVIREWNNHDLAVLIDNSPVAVVEAKLWGSYDIAKWANGKGKHQNSRNRTMDDIEKLRRLHGKCYRYILSFCSHASPAPAPKYQKEVKYRDRITLTPKSESLIDEGYKHLEREWWNVTNIGHGEIKAGRALGVNVSIYFRAYRVHNAPVSGYKRRNIYRLNV